MDDIQSEQWWIVVVKYTLPLVIAVLVLYNMKKGDSTSQTTDKPVVKTYQIHKERSKLNSKELNHHENIQPKGEMICEELENVHEGRDSIKSNREDELLGTTITDDNHLESPTNTQDDEVKQNVANSTTNGNSLGSDLSEFVNDEIPSVMSENNDDTVNLLVNNLHSTEGVSLDERVSSFEPESDVEVPGQIARTEEVDKTLNANIIDNNSVGVETVTIVTESDESKNPESSVELDADIDNAQYEHQQNKHGDELKATPEANMGNNDHQSESETLSESTDVNKNSVFDVLGSKSFAVTSKENDCSGSPKSFTSEQIKAEFFEDISIGDCDYQNGISAVLFCNTPDDINGELDTDSSALECELDTDKSLVKKLQATIPNYAESQSVELQPNELNQVVLHKQLHVADMTPENVLDYLHPAVALPFQISEKVFEFAVDLAVTGLKVTFSPVSYLIAKPTKRITYQ